MGFNKFQFIREVMWLCSNGILGGLLPVTHIYPGAIHVVPWDRGDTGVSHECLPADWSRCYHPLVPSAFSHLIQQLLVKFTSHCLEVKTTPWDKKETTDEKLLLSTPKLTHLGRE